MLAVVYVQPAYVAMPFVTCVGVVVQENPPPPLLAARLSVVDESAVSTLPKTSCSATTTLNVDPVLVEAGGAVV